MAGSAAWDIAHELRGMYQCRQQRVVPEVEQEDEDVSPIEAKGQVKGTCRSQSGKHSRNQRPRYRDSDHFVPLFSGEACGDDSPPQAACALLIPGAQGLNSDDVELIAAVAPEFLRHAAPSEHLIGRNAEERIAVERTASVVHPAFHKSLDALRQDGEYASSSREATPAEEEEAEAAAAGEAKGLEVQVEVTLSSLRGHSQGVLDVIGTLDWSTDGAHFATGGIARKVRVYSLRELVAKKEELLASLEEKRSKSSGEDAEEDEEDEDEEEEEEKVQSREGGDWGSSSSRRGWLKRRQVSSNPDITNLTNRDARAGDPSVPFFMRCGHGGLRRKQKASSTNNLEELVHRQSERTAREHFLDSDACAAKIICAAAKLSSLQWSPWKGGVVGCGDYDGVFCEWDVESGMCVSERDEHSGQKIWSIRYAPEASVGLAASASEDGTVKLWEAASEACCGTVRPCAGSALCSVDLSGDGRLLAAGCADANVYMYDLRQLQSPLAVLQGHERTVSYTRFLNCSTVVSSSTDSTVKVWDLNRIDLPKKGRPSVAAPAASASDHVNRRNFTGLAVRSDGVILTGSEANEIVGYKYTKGLIHNCLSFSYSSGETVGFPPGSLSSPSMCRKPFVSAVSWQNPSSGFVGAANSEGTVRILRVA